MSDTATAGHRLLGPDDEPQDSGAAVAVHWGDYRAQEIWVRSGSNIGAWYPLGGEHWVVWDRKRMPAGVTKQHPEWRDVLARGPHPPQPPRGDPMTDPQPAWDTTMQDHTQAIAAEFTEHDLRALRALTPEQRAAQTEARWRLYHHIDRIWSWPAEESEGERTAVHSAGFASVAALRDLAMDLWTNAQRAQADAGDPVEGGQ